MTNNLFKTEARKTLSIFTTAGYPNLDSLNEQLQLFEANAIDFVEVGIPFSDPMADGPVIQASSMKALENGMNLNVLFEQLSRRSATTPIVLMGYLNPVLQYGLTRFLEKAENLGVKGLVLPDLSVELYEQKYLSLFSKYSVPVCFLVTPNTADHRIQRAAALSRNGFLYLVSSNSTTGNSKSNYTDLQERYKQIKSLAGATPVIIGFGIRDKASFDSATLHVDGGIIGSAFIQAAKKSEQNNFIKMLSENRI